MNTLTRHIIECIALDVRTPTGGYALQQELADWLRGEAIPAIDRLCEEVLPRDARLHIERIELDLGRMRVLDLNLPGVRADLLERLLSRLRDYLLEELSRHSWAGTQVQKNSGSSQPLFPAGEENSALGKPFAAWLFFLEHGYLPWWSGGFPPAAEWSVFLTEQLTAHAPDRARLRRLLRRSRNAVRRLVGDQRHEAAFRRLLAARSLSPGWEIWRSAQGDYAELRPRLPDVLPTSREWMETGKAFFWWVALDEVASWTEAEVVAGAVAAVFPNPAAQRTVGAVLGDEVVRHLSKNYIQDTGDGNIKDPRRRPTGARGSSADGAAEADKSEDPPSKVGDNPPKESPIPPPEDPAGSTPSLAPAPPPNPRHPNTPVKQVPDHVLSGQDGAGRPSGVDRKLPDVPQTLTGSGSAADRAVPDALGTSLPGKDSWYVRWTGVVLVHPYLAPLFTALGYWQEGDFADEVARQRAVYLTHYLATGQRAADEEQLLLPKLLCGWPVSGPPAGLTEPLADPECHEADEVLRAVIKHWSASGLTSPDGLRGGFFARDGRLELEESGWRITVDRKAQDILLGSLPWGISLVYAPWHERPIKVEW